MNTRLSDLEQLVSEIKKFRPDCKVAIYEGDIVIYRDNNAERRGSINWDSKAAAFYFGQDFLVHYPSENMVVVGNEFDI